MEANENTMLVPKWKWQLISSFLVVLFIAVGSTISVTIVWLVLLTINVGNGNKQRQQSDKKDSEFQKEMRDRLEQIEKSAVRIEESTEKGNN